MPETHFAVRKVYDESQNKAKMGDGLLISPSARGHAFENRRLFGHHFHPYNRYTNLNQEPRQVDLDSKRNIDESKISQVGIEHCKKHHDSEAEIEIDVVQIKQDETDGTRHDDEYADVRKSEIEAEEKRIINDDHAQPRSAVEYKQEMRNDYHKSYRLNNEDALRSDCTSIDRTSDIEEQRRKRDEFIRSKCGEVLSVMFPDFDGRLIKRIAESSDYDIQKSVEQLLEIKKKMRLGHVKSAFSAYHDGASPIGGRPSCQCCTGRPMPAADMKPRYFEMRKRDWVEVGIQDGRIHETSGTQRVQLGV